MENKTENKIEKKGGGKIKIIVIVLIAVIIVGVGGYFGYTMFLNKKNPDSKTAAKGAVTQQAQVQKGQQGTTAQQGQQSYLEQIVSEKNFGLDETLINLADEDGKRYLKTKIFVGYNEKKLDAELKEKKPLLRDAVISVLRNKKAADINPKNMDSLKMELIQKMNPMLKNGQLNNVFFNDILIQ